MGKKKTNLEKEETIKMTFIYFLRNFHQLLQRNTECQSSIWKKKLYLINITAMNNHNFSAFVDYNSTEDFISIEETLIETLNNQLTQDIFDKAFGGEW